jgi:nickel transport protein
MNIPLIFIFCLLTTLLSPLEAAHAHKVRIFAYAQETSIFGETAFSGGRPAKNSMIIVKDDASGRTLLTTQTDEQGKFTFPLPPELRNSKTDILIIVNSGEGHRGEWRMTAKEYLSGGQAGLVTVTSEPVADEPPATTIEPGSKTNNSPPKEEILDREQLSLIVEKALDRKLAPIKEQLAKASDPGPNFRDILGGIGYILGLAGIAAYFHAKKKEKRDA